MTDHEPECPAAQGSSHCCCGAIRAALARQSQPEPLIEGEHERECNARVNGDEYRAIIEESGPHAAEFTHLPDVGCNCDRIRSAFQRGVHSAARQSLTGDTDRRGIAIESDTHIPLEDRVAVHDHKGFSEEMCVRCGWKMGNPPLNCQNNNTPHVFPSSALTGGTESATTCEHCHLPIVNDAGNWVAPGAGTQWWITCQAMIEDDRGLYSHKPSAAQGDSMVEVRAPGGQLQPMQDPYRAPNTHQGMTNEILREGADRLDAQKQREMNYGLAAGVKRNTVHGKHVIAAVMKVADAEIAAAQVGDAETVLDEWLTKVGGVPFVIGYGGADLLGFTRDQLLDLLRSQGEG